jgi:hypothetical protein
MVHDEIHISCDIELINASDKETDLEKKKEIKTETSEPEVAEE